MIKRKVRVGRAWFSLVGAVMALAVVAALWLVAVGAAYGAPPNAAMDQPADLSAAASKSSDASAPTVPKVLRIGVQESSLPFAFRGADGGFHGYSVDICKQVVERLRTSLSLPEGGLAVEYVPITSKSRMPKLLAGEIDLECGSTSNTTARRRLGLAFSPTIFVSDVAVLMTSDLADAARGPSAWAERLQAQPVPTLVTTAGSTSVLHLRELARLAGGKLDLVYGGSHDDSFRRLERNEAQAFVMDRALLTSRLAVNENLARRGFVVSSWSLAQEQKECYGLMLRDGGSPLDVALKGAVQDAVLDLMSSGELRRLHRRWFEQPIADPRMRPVGMRGEVVLGETISYALRRQIANPAVDACERDPEGAVLVLRGRR